MRTVLFTAPFPESMECSVVVGDDGITYVPLRTVCAAFHKRASNVATHLGKEVVEGVPGFDTKQLDPYKLFINLRTVEKLLNRWLSSKHDVVTALKQLEIQPLKKREREDEKEKKGDPLVEVKKITGDTIVERAISRYMETDQFKQRVEQLAHEMATKRFKEQKELEDQLVLSAVKATTKLIESDKSY